VRPDLPPPQSEAGRISLEKVRWASVEAFAKEMQKLGGDPGPDPLTLAQHRSIVMEAVDLITRADALRKARAEQPVRQPEAVVGPPTDLATGRPIQELLGQEGKSI
jgi:hypothetical protein